MPCCSARPLACGPMTSPNRMRTHCGGRNGGKTRSWTAAPLRPPALGRVPGAAPPRGGEAARVGEPGLAPGPASPGLPFPELRWASLAAARVPRPLPPRSHPGRSRAGRRKGGAHGRPAPARPRPGHVCARRPRGRGLRSGLWRRPRCSSGGGGRGQRGSFPCCVCWCLLAILLQSPFLSAGLPGAAGREALEGKEERGGRESGRPWCRPFKFFFASIFFNLQIYILQI